MKKPKDDCDYDYDYDSDALSDITNLIAQEMYKLSIRINFTSDYDTILNLHECIKCDLDYILEEFYERYLYEGLVMKLLNCIVIGSDKEFLLEETFNYIENLMEQCIEEDEECFSYYNKLKIKCEKSIYNIFKQYSSLSFEIMHKYPPYVLCIDNDLKLALNYYYSLDYKPKIKKEQNNKTITHIEKPYDLIKPYDYSIYHSRPLQRTIKTPTLTFKRKLNTYNDFNFKNESEMDAFFLFHSYQIKMKYI
ncbi:hypothetical protein [Providencia stuartii]|uniref:hypothetical protein n=1 Tax=Providencia stuartii TaxID=588 RepID=UPI0026519676|nr:hypothetical protein [Providencia stuartii]MDN7223087.1 hypothetical protein [Providencia stuartii]